MNEITYPPGCKDIQVELANDELIRRLKKIQQAFQNIDQSATERYKGLALYLGCDLFLQHEHEDVQLLVACCLADIFRIYAPDSPFEDPNNLKNIFIFLANQLKGLKDNSNPSFKRYFYLLENLECVKTFQLCTELDESQEIIATLFESAFKIVNDKTTAKVKSLLFDLLCPLLNESDQISSRVLDTLFARIIEPQKSNNKEAYTMAVNLLKRGNQHFEFLVQNHLNNILLTSRNNMGNNLTLAASNAANMSAHSNSSNDSSFLNSSNVDADHSGVTGSANQFISDKLCLIIYELNTIRYAFLELLMPQLEYKLKSSDLKERREYTKLLSKMFSEKDSTLAKQLPQLWEAYLERFADMNEDIRKICVQHICDFLVQLSTAIKPITSSSGATSAAAAVANPPSPAAAAGQTSSPSHILEQIIEQVKNRALDSDESIRYEVVQEILKAIKLDSNLITIDLLNVLHNRTLDIKIRVRKLALQGLAALYKKIHSKVYDRQTIQIVSWIPSKIMKIYFQDSTEDKLLVERLLNTSIVPYTLGPREKMAQLYYAYCTFDEYSILSLIEIMKNRVLLYQLIKSVIEVVEAPTRTPELEARLNRDAMLIAQNLLDTVKGSEFMKAFVGLLKTNLNLKKYLKSFISLSCSSANAMQLIPIILNNMNSLNQGQMTMGRRLVERMSSLIVDKECIESLLELVEYKIKQKLTLKQRRMLSRQKRAAAKGEAKSGRGRGRRGGAGGAKIDADFNYSDYEDEGAESDENGDEDDDSEDEDDELDELDDENEENERENDDADSETRENAEIVRMLVKHIDDDGQKGLALINMILSIHSNYGFNNLASYEKLFTFTNSRKDHVVSSALKILSTYFASRAPAPGSGGAPHARTMDVGEEEDFDRINNQYLNKLKNFSINGKPKQAKYSLYCIYHNFEKSAAETVLNELRQDLQKEILAKNHKTFVSSLISLGHICYLIPQLVGKELKEFVSKSVVKELLIAPIAAAAASLNATTAAGDTSTLTAAKRKANLKLAGKWCENEDELPFATRSRIEAIKLLVRWCLGLRGDCDSILPTLKILIKLLKDNSDQQRVPPASADTTTTTAAAQEVSAAERARLRSICGNQLLKLGQEKCFKMFITPEFFHIIARLIIDPVTNVRDIFIKKLKKGLLSSKLPFYYMAVFALSGYDASRERKTRVKKIYLGLVKNMRQIDAKQQQNAQRLQQQAGGAAAPPPPRIIPEMCLSYAISLLAHNIKIESIKDDLKIKQIKECVLIILDPLLENPDGYQIAYIKNLLGKIKTFDDGLAAATALQAKTNASPQYPAAAQNLFQINKNLCTICEIFLFHMHSKLASSFTNKEHKFDVKLPAGFFSLKEKLNGAESEEQKRLNEELRSSQKDLQEMLGEHGDETKAAAGAAGDDEDAASDDADKDINKENTNNSSKKWPTTSRIEIIPRKRKSADEEETTTTTTASGARSAKSARASKNAKSPLSSSTSSKQNDSNAVEEEEGSEDEDEDVPLGSLMRSKNQSPAASAAKTPKGGQKKKGAKAATETTARSRSPTPPAPPNKRNKKSEEPEENNTRKSARKSIKASSTTVSPNTSTSSTASSAKQAKGGKQQTATPSGKKKPAKKEESEPEEEEEEEEEENDENDASKAKSTGRRSIRAATSNKKSEPAVEAATPTSQRPKRAAAAKK